MPRLRNVQTDVVISVNEETAAGLATSEWVDADEAKSKTPAKKAASSKSDDK